MKFVVNRQTYRKLLSHLLCSASLSALVLILIVSLNAHTDDYLLLSTILMPLIMIALLDFWSGLLCYSLFLLAYFYLLPQPLNTPLLLSMVAVGVILLSVGYAFSHMKQKLKSTTQQANQDRLTGAYTRHYGEMMLQKELERAVFKPRTTSLLVLDIDHFKQFNDTYGHQMGDNVLTQLVSVLQLNLRSIDTLIRWGGEEFCVLLPRTVEDEAFIMAERLRARVAKHSFSGVASVQISIGLSSSAPNDHVNDLFKRADQMLYEAKKQGRNRVVSHKLFQEELARKTATQGARNTTRKPPTLLNRPLTAGSKEA